MSGNNWTAYVVGAVVGIVIGVFTAGIGFAAYAGTMGTLAFGVTTSLMLASNAQKTGGTGLKNAAAKDLEIASASESIAVPVVFGTTRIGGNFIHYDRATFRNEAIYQEQQVQGGKGGGGDSETQQQLVGYKYFLSYLYGICMGQLDAVYNVWDANEMKIVGSGTGFSADHQAISLSGSDFGGTINVYRGSATQSRFVGDAYATNGLNYRHVAFASFPDHWIGNNPVPRTILFEVQRWPRVLDANGDAIAGFYTTGSLTSGGRCWRDANPAAILYELFTDKVWGRGMSPDYIDIPSFVEASVFFATNDIGISLAIDAQQNISEAVDFVRRHVNTAVVWNGEKLVCRVLMNPGDTTPPIVITSEQVTKPTLSRPAWPETPNELRLEFLNRNNAWKSEVAMIQDDANIEASGLINSQRVVLNGFTDRTTAEAQAQRILNEMSFPQATLTFYMNRWASRIIPGDRVRFVWGEFTEQDMHTFWRVIEISDAEQNNDGIRVTLAEDLYATPYLGEETAFAPVTPSFADDAFNDDGDLVAADDANANLDPGDMLPIRAFELPFSAARGSRRFAVLQEQGNSATLYATHLWALDGTGDFATLASTRGWCITGELTSAISAGVQDLCRQAGDAFTFTLTNPSNEAALLASANKVGLDADHMDVLLSGKTDLLIIDNEVFHVGKITETSPGVYQVTNYIRAQWGTDRAAHSIGAGVFFIPTLVEEFFVASQGSMPDNAAIDLKTNAVLPSGAVATEFPWSGPSAGGFTGAGARPYSPSYVSHTKIGNDWTVNYRPRWHNLGAGTFDKTLDDLQAIVTTMPVGYATIVQPMNGGTPLSDPVPVSTTFVPDNGIDATGGLLNFTHTAPAGSTHLRVWQSYNGAASLAPTTIAA